jgi:hypothetical protein
LRTLYNSSGEICIVEDVLEGLIPESNLILSKNPVIGLY